MKFILYFLLFTFLSCIGPKSVKPKAVKGVLDLTQWNFEKEGIINLDGEWEFYPREFLSPGTNRISDEKSSQRNSKDSSPSSPKIPNYITVPGSWNNLIINEKPMGSKGFGTYYLKILLPDPDKYPAGSFGLKTSYLNDSFAIYGNDKKIASAGKISDTEEKSEKGGNIKLFELKKEIIFSQENGDRILNLVIHVSNYSHRTGGIINSYRFGELDRLITKDKWTYIFDFFLFGSIFIMGIYHFGLYSLRKNDSSPLWFGTFCILICLRILLLGEKYLDLAFPSYSKLFLFIEYIGLIFLVPVFTNFIYYLFPFEFKYIIKKGIQWVGILLVLPVLFLPSFYFTHTLTLIQIYILISSIYGLYVLLFASQNHRQGAKFFLIGFIFFFILIIHDILANQEVIQSINLVPLGLLIFIFSQAYVLSMRFSNAFKESEEQRRLLAQAKLEIENLSRTKDLFLSNLSHEIKTPLSVVYAYSQMLPTQKENPNKIEKYSEQIFTNASRLNDYVSDLILVTDIETNLELQKTDADMKNILIECISSLTELAEEKSIQLEYKETNLINLYCDPLLLKKAILAVLKNAIVYNQPNGIVTLHTNGIVTIRTIIDQKEIKIIIQDTGIGIEQSFIDRIFEKFFRVDSSLTYEVSGVGIGLFLAKKIIELHKGRIEVKSELGIGSEFIIILPILETGSDV